MTRCDIIIPIYNQRQDTENCLVGLKRHTDVDYRLILVDNASEAETADWLARVAETGEFGPTLLIRNEVNMGWTGGTNQGLEASTAPYICLLNNDTLPGPGWLSRLLAFFGEKPDLAMISPGGDESSINARVFGRIEEYSLEIAREFSGQWRELDHCSGFCMVMPRSVYEALGNFDPAYNAGNWADNDYARRAQARGWFCAEALDAFVFHLGHLTFDQIDQKWREQSSDNYRLFCERWGEPRRVFMMPGRRLDRSDDKARADLEALYKVARRGHVVYVPLIHGEGPEGLLEAHGLVEHANIRFLGSPLPWPLSLPWAAWKRQYLQKKGRVNEEYRGDWNELAKGL